MVFRLPDSSKHRIWRLRWNKGTNTKLNEIRRHWTIDAHSLFSSPSHILPYAHIFCSLLYFIILYNAYSNYVQFVYKLLTHKAKKQIINVFLFRIFFFFVLGVFRLFIGLSQFFPASHPEEHRIIIWISNIRHKTNKEEICYVPFGYIVNVMLFFLYFPSCFR